MIRHNKIPAPVLRSLIRQGEIILSRNERLKTYGSLNCRSGRRIKKQNRVFFDSEQEALKTDFRPCGHCLAGNTKNGEMKLFKDETIPNLLPFDGIVQYLGKIFTSQESELYRNLLLQHIAWKQDEAVIFGRHIITKRKVAWYADIPYQYTYSNITKQALPWTGELVELKNRVEHLTGDRFNSCLLNLYHNGEEGMAWHSDDEKSLGKDTTIASVSFGAERKFSLKHKKSGERISLLLEQGSLLVMKGTTQTHWLHRLPPSKKIIEPRINLTFRTMIV